jgi:ABC-2 type transport system ATP-binding protein
MIKTQEISKRYGKVQALNNISIEIDLSGEIYGLIGPNGSGKTTLISIISGFTQSNSGTISGIEKNYIGSCVGNESFIDHLTVLEWLNFLLKIKNLSTDELAIFELLELMNMNGEKSQKIKSLSFGQKQRLGIISALCGDPKLVIFDEPLNGLDPSGVFLFKNVLNWLVEKKITVLYSSHRLDDLANYCTHLFLLDQGSLMYDGYFKEFLKLGNGNIEDSYNHLIK